MMSPPSMCYVTVCDLIDVLTIIGTLVLIYGLVLTLLHKKPQERDNEA